MSTFTRSAPANGTLRRLNRPWIKGDSRFACASIWALPSPYRLHDPGGLPPSRMDLFGLIVSATFPRGQSQGIRMTGPKPTAGAVASTEGSDATPAETHTPAEFRARAEEARQNAAAEVRESVRKVLLNDAELWERMAAYEEKHLQPK